MAFLLFHMRIYGFEEDELAAQNELEENREINLGRNLFQATEEDTCDNKSENSGTYTVDTKSDITGVGCNSK
jgi:hypothetical protein